MRCALHMLFMFSVPALGNESLDSATSSLKRLSLEELLSVEVSSVSKTDESLATAAAAVTVVSADDIRRAGATSVPEALRLVPGIDVAQRTASSWAVSSRGFSSVNSEKLLVLSDTRSVYTPLFSGVFWDTQDYIMQDIDRIEVIRGPGAALWGSNAVNGVINITTRNARDTQGLYLEGSGGTEKFATAVARYGGTTENGISYRVFGKYLDRGDTFHPGLATSDDWRLAHIGFRADWDAAAADAVTVQGDAYRGNIGQLYPSLAVSFRPAPAGDLFAEVSGGNILGRWRRTFSPNSDLQVRAYYDHTHRDDPTFHDELDTVDLDVQHRFAFGSRQEIIWGANYRGTTDRLDGQGAFVGALQPRTSRDTLLSAFAQDQITVSKAFRVTLGTKLEHNDFSGFEVQPSVRAAWDVAASSTLWAAVSRAVRVPTRIERDISIDASDPAANPVIRLLGNRDFGAEDLIAYEIGHRWHPVETVSIDLAAFHNQYRRLASLELGTPFIDATTGRTVLPVVNRNLTHGRAAGVEAQVLFVPVERWQLTGSYSYLSLHLRSDGLDLNRGVLTAGATPRHQFGLRSSLDLPAGLELDAQLRRVTEVRSSAQLVGSLPAYSELDMQVAWHATQHLELSVVGQSLLHDHHSEFGLSPNGGEVERTVYGKVVFRY